MDMIPVVAILGPTAAGKSALGMELAERFNGEIVSVDSMQVYKFMDIATAKPSKRDRASVAHHLIDIVYPNEDYSAADFKRDGDTAIADIESRGKGVFLVGGCGMYLRALLHGIFEGPSRTPELREGFEKEAALYGKGYLYERLIEVDPEGAAMIHPNNIARIIRALEVQRLTRTPISKFHKEHGFGESHYKILKIGLFKERALLYRDIETRVDRMIREGLLDETRNLMRLGYSPDLKGMQSLGYKEMLAHIQGRAGFEDAIGALKKNTRNYAKRQLTWFRKDAAIKWFLPIERGKITSLVKDFLEGDS